MSFYPCRGGSASETVKRYLLKNGKFDPEFSGISGNGVNSGEVKVTSDGIVIKCSGTQDKTFGSNGSVDLSGYKTLIVEVDVLVAHEDAAIDLDLSTKKNTSWSASHHYVCGLPVTMNGLHKVVLDISSISGSKYFVFYNWSNHTYTYTIKSIGLG